MSIDVSKKPFSYDYKCDICEVELPYGSSHYQIRRNGLEYEEYHLCLKCAEEILHKLKEK